MPQTFKSGDIIKVIILAEDSITFIGIDEKEMERRCAKMKAKKLSLRERAKRPINEA